MPAQKVYSFETKLITLKTVISFYRLSAFNRTLVVRISQLGFPKRTLNDIKLCVPGIKWH